MLPRLRSLRKERDMSQKALADAIGVTQQAINQFESHGVTPSLSLLTCMADFFDTSIDYITGRSNIRKNTDSPKLYDLNDREAEIIQKYRSLSDTKKQSVEVMLTALSED